MRKAINPIIATVLIIVVTLVAAVSIAGFVFGIFGSSSSSAQVIVTRTDCTNNVNGTNCVFQLTNTNPIMTVSLTGASLTISGQIYSGLCPKVSIPQPSIAVSCIFKTSEVFNQVGTGTIQLSNGAILIFTVEVP